MSDAVVQTVDVPGHIFVYRATTAAKGGGAKGAEEEEGADGNNNCYRLEAIRPTLRTVYCSATNLEFTSLADADLVQLQLFNELFVPECNAQALRFVFETDDAGAFLCAPTRQGVKFRALCEAQRAGYGFPRLPSSFEHVINVRLG